MGRKPYMSETFTLPPVSSSSVEMAILIFTNGHKHHIETQDSRRWLNIFDIFAVLKEEQVLHAEVKLASSSL